MSSPLAEYKKLIKEFEVAERETVSPVGKLTYVQEQVGQQQAIINRLLFDMATANVHMSEAKDPITKGAHRKKRDNFADDLVQLLGTVRTNLTLIDELRAEYPELQIEE